MEVSHRAGSVLSLVRVTQKAELTAEQTKQFAEQLPNFVERNGKHGSEDPPLPTPRTRRLASVNGAQRKQTAEQPERSAKTPG